MHDSALPPASTPDVRRPDPSPHSSSLSPHIIGDAARRRRWALLLPMAVALAIAVAYITTTPKKYAATATLLIDARLAQLSQTEASASVVDQAAVESQIELLRSEKILISVIDKLDLWSDPEFGHVSDSSAPADAMAVEIAMRRTVALVEANLWVTRVGRSYLVSVAFNSVNPNKATRIANAVAESYISDQIGSKIEAAKQKTAYLEQRVDENRSLAAKAYRAVQDFKAAHDINPLRDLGVQQEIDRLGAAASRARAVALTLRAGVDRAESMQDGPLRARRTVPDATLLRSFADPALDALSTCFSDLEAKLGSAKAAPNHEASLLARLKLERSDVVQAIWVQIDRLSEQLHARWVIEDAKQQAVDSDLAEVRLRDTRARIVQDRLRELETDSATARSLYETYLNQLTHADQQQAVPSSDARLISAAAIPLLPNTPKKALTLVLAVLSGTALGIAVAFLLETTDDVVRTRVALEGATALPCLGVIPRTRPRRRQREQHLLALYDPAEPWSRAGDTFRSLQLAACERTVGRMAVVLGVTSAVAGAGKTTVAFNLAASACQSGRQTLLIDADLRSRALTRHLSFGETENERSSELGRIVRLSEGFDVLSASLENTIAGAELPEGKLFEAVLTEARYAYDLIIVDLPPILPLSELRSAVQCLDHLILVVRWGATTGAQLKRAVNRMGDRDRFIGTVLNGVKLRTMRRFEGSSSQSYGRIHDNGRISERLSL